jgi:hypothetical protein
MGFVAVVVPLILYHVLVLVDSSLQMQEDEPLTTLLVKEHRVLGFPVIKRPTELHFLEPPSVVVHLERLRLSLVRRSHHQAFALFFSHFVLRCPKVDVVDHKATEVLLLSSKHVLKALHGLVKLGVKHTGFQKGLLAKSGLGVDFASETVELSEPGLADRVSMHDTLESFLSESLVLVLVLVSSDRSLDGVHQVVLIVGLKREAGSFFCLPLELKHRILKPSSFESDHGRLPHEELMLHDTTRFKLRGHEAEVTASVD